MSTQGGTSHEGFKKITKIEAAKRQLETAIKLYFNDEDEISVHTLAAAAHEIIFCLNCSTGIKGKSIIKNPINIREERKKEYLEIMNKATNFFKHAGRDPKDSIEFNQGETEIWLLDSCTMYQSLVGEMTFWMYAFRGWLALNVPELFCLDEQQKDKLSKDDTIKKLGKAGFIKLAWTEHQKSIKTSA